MTATEVDVELHEDGIQLGWEADEGFGDLLIDRLVSGSLDVLYEPLEVLDDDEVEALRASAGHELTVFDADGEPRCNVVVLEVFETSWGEPDPRLVRGDGYGGDVTGWKGANAGILEDALRDSGTELDDDTAFIVQRVRVTETADPG